jgi:methionyl-tRNA synthetase
VHGFLTVNGEKMSKSKGTFIKAATFLKHINPEALRYYYASKLTGAVEDIDLSTTDFINKINSDVVGKLANLPSRSGPMLNKQFNSTLGILDEQGKKLIEKLCQAKVQVINDYENLEYASVVRTICLLADEANRYVETNQPWVTAKTDPQKTITTLTATINAVRILTIYLKPILPKFAEKIEKFLDISPLTFDDVEKIIENRKISLFERLFERIETGKVSQMMEDSRESQVEQKPQINIEPIAAEITIDDFAKIDMRIAKVIKAEKVTGADKLLRLTLDVGGLQREVMAAIALAYQPEQLTGKMVIYLANLKPRQMKFGLSEGMILAAGSGGRDVFMLTIDDGAKPGQRVK